MTRAPWMVRTSWIALLVVGVAVGCKTTATEPVKPVSSAQAEGQPAGQAPEKREASDAVAESAAQAEGSERNGEASSRGGVRQDPVGWGPFPPTMPDSSWHGASWEEGNCLRCHETGVYGATVVRHEGLPAILLTAKCRTCHVFIPNSQPVPVIRRESRFAENAFPPMIPASSSHASVWWKDDCLLCHEDGLRGAPRMAHEGLPRVLVSAKCRTCHVQVRAATVQKVPSRPH